VKCVWRPWNFRHDVEVTKTFKTAMEIVAMDSVEDNTCFTTVAFLSGAFASLNSLREKKLPGKRRAISLP